MCFPVLNTTSHWFLRCLEHPSSKTILFTLSLHLHLCLIIMSPPSVVGYLCLLIQLPPDSHLSTFQHFVAISHMTVYLSSVWWTFWKNKTKQASLLWWLILWISLTLAQSLGWLNIILSVSVRIFLDEIDTEADCLHNMVGLTQSVEGLNGTKRTASSEQQRILLHTAFRLHLQQQLFLAQQKTGFLDQTGNTAACIQSLLTTLQISDFPDSIIILL